MNRVKGGIGKAGRSDTERSFDGRSDADRLKTAGLKGSYTVEASILFCMIIFMLGAILLAAFYLHDRGVLQSSACEAAAAGENGYGQGERTGAAVKVKQQMSAGRLLGSRGLSGNLSVGDDTVTCSWRASFPVPGFAARYLSGGMLSADTSWSVRHIRPGREIRLIRGIGKLLGGGED